MSYPVARSPSPQIEIRHHVCSLARFLRRRNILSAHRVTRIWGKKSPCPLRRCLTPGRHFTYKFKLGIELPLRARLNAVSLTGRLQNFSQHNQGLSAVASSGCGDGHPVMPMKHFLMMRIAATRCSTEMKKSPKPPYSLLRTGYESILGISIFTACN